ncbi:hypothetical protein [Myroides odoratus]|uniref:Uncharacterized protein n=1 Tax=Myroides odoratus TaxID=256 RepID=A0A9Q6ZFB6_MYROD|nr:hypothetical protein [Myroides odoratus]EHQ44384.1 hypothetical protein Myrod_3587 [Myroides odoratus DSM 2801]EKB03850.1 hypothetical protein HMPREF9716_03397 [Myroides odoratus CIP 103059]QQU01656.1 hypothetical protein I6I88_07945 [Myroides odoratus]WQD56063.1 hypothetical protein U0010_11040 [Myroides odoratus]STZ31723.1 Uncharacterised protein [Myroides odoratus]
MNSIKQSQYIFSIFILFLAIQMAPNAYGQRELSIYEPMYTYDYEVKRQLAEVVINKKNLEYWLIENFKATKGIKNIEVYPKYLSENAIRSFYVYNPESGYLIREIHHRLTDSGDVISNSLYGAVYEYNLDKDIIKIKKYDLKDRNRIVQYDFDRHSEMLTKKIDTDTTYYYYYTNEIHSPHYILKQIKTPKYLVDFEMNNYHDSIFKYQQEPFIYAMSGLYLNESPKNKGIKFFSNTGKLKDQKKGSKTQAKNFNSFIQKNVVNDSVHFRVFATTRIKAIETNQNTDIEWFQFWVTKHTITSMNSEDRVLWSFKYDPATGKMLDKSCYGGVFMGVRAIDFQKIRYINK